MPYPETRIDPVTEVLTGVAFPDPYRWLEDKTDEVERWQQAQAKLASAHVREWPHFHRLRRLVEHFNAPRYVTLPRYAGDRWFRLRVPEGASQAQAIVADTPFGKGRLLFDPAVENPQRPPYVTWISPSPDGRTLALGVCADGSENNTIRLIDVATGGVLAHPPAQTLMDDRTGGVHWLPDSSGFFFSAITGTAVEFEQRVYLHRRSPTPKTELLDIAWTEDKDYRMVVVSPDGRHAIALERLRQPIPVAIAALGADPVRWRSFVSEVSGTIAGHVIGERYIAVTDVGASRGRLIAIPLGAPNPNDPKCWEELVPESDAVLRTVTPVGDALYLSEFVDTYARVRIVNLDGQDLGAVPVAARGAISEMPFPLMNLLPKGHPHKFLFAFSSLTVSWGIYSHTPGQEGIEILQAPRVQLENVVVEDVHAVSADGTHIPYHIVRRAEADASQPQPTLIYAYGGLNVPWVPQFSGPMAAFVAAGGVFVHAHLRGGGELGLQWWEAGRLLNKQNCYDDLFAVAEHLIATDRATPESLAVIGGSLGGLLAGVAVTQRPDLWKVVVARVPVLDLVGSCRQPYGRMITMQERANVEDPAEVRRLATFSPYHLVREGVRYPAVFLDAGDTDPRCPAWHARKFAARLQRATAGGAPILLHVWENAGHGFATDKNTLLDQHTEWLAFTLRHLGIDDWCETTQS